MTPNLALDTERDWVTEMRDIINLRATGTISAPVAAREIVDELFNNDPELLTNWLLLGAVGFIRDAINARDKSKRGRNRSIAGRSPEIRVGFRNAIATGDVAEIRRLSDTLNDKVVTDFLQERYVVPSGDRMTFGDMGREERLYVADGYRVAAKEHALREAFIRAVDKRAGLKRTSEVFSEEKLAKLWHSLSGSAH
jgi:hypothetical protein